MAGNLAESRRNLAALTGCAEPAHGAGAVPILNNAIISGVPSPIGHILGGVAAGWIAAPAADRRALALCAFAGAIADVDLFLPIAHRGPLHSIAAAVAAGVIVLVVLGRSSAPVDCRRLALALAAAYGSHVLLDWMGADTSSPRGLMALWPFTSDYFISDLTIFRAISRRYWMSNFWWDNTVAVLQELAILGPVVALIAWRVNGRGHSRAAP
jgi:inner membrane protein